MCHDRSIILCAAIVSALAAQPACAQNGHGRTSRFSVQVSTGKVFGGPSQEMANDMGASGYADTKEGYCINTTLCVGTSYYYPHRWTPGATQSAAVRFSVRPNLAVTAGVGKADLGGADGYREIERINIQSAWTARSYWAGVLWVPTPTLRLGGGPAYYRLTEYSVLGETQDRGRVGAFAESGIVWPARGTVYFDVSLRAHLVRNEKVIEPTYSPLTSTWPHPMTPHLSHQTIMLGIGFRL